MTNKPRAPLNEKKVKVYEIIFNMCVKFILICVGIVAFFIILSKILNTEPGKMTVVYGGLEAFLSYTLYVVYKHYFPTKE